jgi:hypothetical protein
MSTIIRYSELPKKFLPYLLTNGNLATVDNAFHSPSLKRINDYTFGGSICIFTRPRTDGVPALSDSHIYNVRKASKIYGYLKEHGLENHITLSPKRLYWNKQFYVVSNKMNLTDEVISCASAEMESAIRDQAVLKRQAAAFIDGPVQRDLTPIQARGLAELAVDCGFTGITRNNFSFTPEGRVVILHTDPLHRVVKKAKCSWKSFLWNNKSSLCAQQAMMDIANLKIFCKDPAAKRAVDQVAFGHLLYHLFQLIAKVALIVLVSREVLPRVANVFALSDMHKSVFNGAFRIPLTLKAGSLLLDILQILLLWTHSYNGVRGLKRMEEMHEQGSI